MYLSDIGESGFVTFLPKHQVNWDEVIKPVRRTGTVYTNTDVLVATTVLNEMMSVVFCELIHCLCTIPCDIHVHVHVLLASCTKSLQILSGLEGGET